MTTAKFQESIHHSCVVLKHFDLYIIKMRTSNYSSSQRTKKTGFVWEKWPHFRMDKLHLVFSITAEALSQWKIVGCSIK